MYDNRFRFVTHFYVIIYARLSKEESGKPCEEQSKSIKNQIEICKRYIEEEQKRFPNCIFETIATLTDDGISGTTFDRADFKELVQLIEEKRSNMVITTDLSRLGRNHVKTDDYIEQWFPDHNVRYISIVEGVDTYADCMNNDIAPIINWSNEHFAKLTSKKIKSRFNILRSDGKWTGGEPPLGYKLDKNDKYHFIIDETEAEIIRHIFSLFIEHKSLAKVREILSIEKVLIPSLLKKNRRRINDNTKDIWSIKTIKEILTNEMYLGHMVQGKTTRLNHKSKKMISLPKSSWTIVKDTHDPIVDEKTFVLANAFLKTNKNKTHKSYDYLLKGLLKCKECGHSIGVQHYKDRRYNYTICNYYRKYGKLKEVCTSHRFKYEDIERVILEQVKLVCQESDSKSIVAWAQAADRKKKESEHLKEKTLKLEKEINLLEKEIDFIYGDRVSGLIDEGQYRRATFQKKELLDCKKRILKSIQKKRFEKNDSLDYGKIVDNLFKNPNRALLITLIDKICISESGIIDIYYNVIKP